MTAEAESGGWFARLKARLGRSSAKLGEVIGAIFTRRKLYGSAIE